MENYMREPINTLTHLVGAVLSLIGLIAMVIKTVYLDSSILDITSVIVFGISMILLYLASTTYHMVLAKDKVISFLRRLDHSMIFVLIAGTYTPFCLISLNGKTGWIIFSIVTFIALCGIMFKMIWFNCPRWLSTSLYIALGWVIVIASAPLSKEIGLTGLSTLIVGGLFYTIGGVIYGLKPKFLSFKNWGFHEIFHVFIMLGTLSHFLCVYLFVL
ncbi:hemolysin III family protein [Bacillus sp. EAC]|uniref:PAQR family membrane homeostasis protein TrhA n=1 Tax=Bacillus sp. EAC TaxID=1978338 RepID=UPI000B44AA6B|nr:hemolysin III family protein [Bacillus sp. EAC]